MKLYRCMTKFVPTLKARHGNRDLFSARTYGELVAIGCVAAKETGLASKKRTPIQAALMSFSFCWFSKATGEIWPSELWRLFGL